MNTKGLTFTNRGLEPLVNRIRGAQTKEIDTKSNRKQKILKFRCLDSMGYESQKCTQADQGGLLGGNKTCLLFPPSLLATYN
jgi:hypothetical protein